MASHYTVPGLGPDDAKKVAEILQARLTSLVDVQLTLEQVVTEAPAGGEVLPPRCPVPPSSRNKGSFRWRKASGCSCGTRPWHPSGIIVTRFAPRGNPRLENGSELPITSNHPRDSSVN